MESMGFINVSWEGGGLCCCNTVPHPIAMGALCHDVHLFVGLTRQLLSNTAGITKAAATTSTMKVMAGSVISTFIT